MEIGLFFALQYDILRHIYESFLTIQDAAHFDAAIVNKHMRAVYDQYLHDGGGKVEQKSICVSGEMELVSDSVIKSSRVFRTRKWFQHRPLEEYNLQWCFSRNLLVSSIALHGDALFNSSTNKETLDRISSPSLQKLIFNLAVCRDVGMKNNDSQSMEQFAGNAAHLQKNSHIEEFHLIIPEWPSHTLDTLLAHLPDIVQSAKMVFLTKLRVNGIPNNLIRSFKSMLSTHFTHLKCLILTNANDLRLSLLDVLALPLPKLESLEWRDYTQDQLGTTNFTRQTIQTLINQSQANEAAMTTLQRLKTLILPLLTCLYIIPVFTVLYYSWIEADMLPGNRCSRMQTLCIGDDDTIYEHAVFAERMNKEMMMLMERLLSSLHYSANICIIFEYIGLINWPFMHDILISVKQLYLLNIHADNPIRLEKLDYDRVEKLVVTGISRPLTMDEKIELYDGFGAVYPRTYMKSKYYLLSTMFYKGLTDYEGTTNDIQFLELRRLEMSPYFMMILALILSLQILILDEVMMPLSDLNADLPYQQKIQPNQPYAFPCLHTLILKHILPGEGDEDNTYDEELTAILVKLKSLRILKIVLAREDVTMKFEKDEEEREEQSTYSSYSNIDLPQQQLAMRAVTYPSDVPRVWEILYEHGHHLHTFGFSYEKRTSMRSLLKILTSPGTSILTSDNGDQEDGAGIRNQTTTRLITKEHRLTCLEIYDNDEASFSKQSLQQVFAMNSRNSCGNSYAQSNASSTAPLRIFPKFLSSKTL